MRSVELPGLWGKWSGVPLVPWEQQPVQPLTVRPARCRRRPVLCPVPCMAPLMPLEMPWVRLAMQLVALQGRSGGQSGDSCPMPTLRMLARL